MRMRGARARSYGVRMSVEAARAAELLTQLAVPARLLVLGELGRRGLTGATLAELTEATGLPLAKTGDACARLVGLGLAAGDGNGTYRARLDGLRDAAAAVDGAQPIAALLDGYPQLRAHFAHGRLTTMPPTLGDRYTQLGELLVRFLALDDLCGEDELNRRLSAITDDVAGVRRMLVDTGWLERDRAGTTYGQARPVPA
jgi:hypothetical protein